jgi:hypothetical protein
MYRYHRVLYRRLLRSQSIDDLRRLRVESAQYPRLAGLIDDELTRRRGEGKVVWTGGSGRVGKARPVVVGAGAWSRS